MFGGRHGLLVFAGTALIANPEWKKPIIKAVKNSSEEVMACSKRAEFVGKWFASSGSASAVMAILGVRP